MLAPLLWGQESVLAPGAATQKRELFTFARFDELSAAWQGVALGAVVLALLAFVVWMYRRESVDLPRGVAAWLGLLRAAAIAALLVYYLQPERRTEQRVVQNSKVLVLVDTSLSMGLEDAPQSNSPRRSRIAQVVDALGAQGLLDTLRQKHDVSLLRFDAELQRIALLNRRPGGNSAADRADAAASAATNDRVELDSARATAATPEARPDEPAAWPEKLLASGAETRLGQALGQALHDERTAPLSGIVLFTDGGQNGGPEPSAALQAAREAKIPVFPVGVGSAEHPKNVRIADLSAPSRAFVGSDAFQVLGLIQSHGLEGTSIDLELESRDALDPASAAQIEGTASVVLGSDAEPVSVRFDVVPKVKGRRVLQLKLASAAPDADAADNHLAAEVEVVDHQTKVLLLAGGPTREFIFVRSLLFRDHEMISDVLLQSPAHQAAVSQDAHAVLDDFPSQAAQMYDYDCLIAFDANWAQLSADQVDLLEDWVAERAGGLVLIAGPVQTDRLAQDERLGKVRGLFPVEFHRRLTSLGDAKYGSESAWPLEFSREGAEAEFLWLGSNATESRAAWSAFPGVFGFYDVRRAKDAATVYARYANPEATSGSEMPVYMAGQFYGSGKVFYLGSGEMWRLRGVDERYFEQFYTKLVRHVAQGRLLAGSNHGMLLVDQDRYVQGATMIVRARLTDAQFQPLTQPSVTAQVVLPSGATDSQVLHADPERQGMYVGQLTAIEEGVYHLELPLPDDSSQRLSRRIQVRAPRLEREHPERNDPLLAEIAQATGGQYYVGTESLLGGSGQKPLAELLPDRTKSTELPPLKDMEFDRQFSQWFLAIMVGLLTTEWLSRRLAKLA